MITVIIQSIAKGRIAYKCGRNGGQYGRKQQEEKPFTIEKDGEDFVIKGEKVEKLFKMTKFTDEGIKRFSNKLRKMGIDEELEKMGAIDGDMVRILDFYFEYRK